MPTTKQLTIESVKLNSRQEMDTFFEQVTGAGIQRVRADIAALQAKGLMDYDGELLVSELPPDMREGAERDFGG